MKVPFFDWQAFYSERGVEFGRIFHETASRGAFVLQRDVDEFEGKLAAFCGVKHAIGVADCTNGMLLGLRAVGLKPGDEVVLSSHSFVAAAQSIHFAGGVPVPVELGPDFLVDPAAMESAITPRTRALMPVHVNGRVCNMDAIQQIARRHSLIVIEDAAQAVGAQYKGVCAGNFGAWGTYSFYPSKTLGCFGDAGALVTNDDTIADKVRRMRNHGANEQKTLEVDNRVWGTNSRLDNLHAAILVYKLSYYPETLERRRAIARRYDEAFRDLPGLALPPAPDASRDRFDIYQNYEMCSDRRDALRAYLAEHQIGTIVQWGGLGLHQMTGLGFGQHLPKTDAFFASSLLLPMNHVLTDAQIDHVIANVRRFVRA